MKYGLSDATISKIHQVFVRFPQVKKVVVYGSRAKGHYRPGSDIDLTLFGDNLDYQQCADIAAALDDLLLPYMIDLSVFDQLTHPELKDHIERVGQLFYQKE